MFNKYLVIDKEITDFEKLDKIVKESKLYDGGLEFLLGIETQEELEKASPWVSYEDGCTVFYEDVVKDQCSNTEYIHVPIGVKEMRDLLNLSRIDFSLKYEIPVRTLEDWEAGKRTAPTYVLKLLERAVLEDSKEL